MGYDVLDRSSDRFPLKIKRAIRSIGGSDYHEDEWARRRPIFDGLPADGFMDGVFSHEIIADPVWTGLQPPAEAVAGVNNVSINYSSGLMVSMHTAGAGRFVLNTLRILDNLGRHPARNACCGTCSAMRLAVWPSPWPTYPPISRPN